MTTRAAARRATALVVASLWVVLALGAAPAQAQGSPAASDATVAALGRAGRAAAAGAWAEVRVLLAPLGDGAELERSDRGELHRLSGLAAFHLGDLPAAERQLLAFLRLDPDAQLDPALVPPEAVRFFDDVRARHLAELRALRAPPRRYLALNLVPPAGQFQNRQPVKGWLLGAGLLTLAATNLTSYLVVRGWCDDDHQLCEDGDGRDRAGAARRLRTVTNTSGALLLGLYAYGVIDGFVGYRRRTRVLRIEALSGGGMVSLAGTY
ncbi:MAG: hypothetical protein KA297_15325 [Kofleriaceae bacterium]|jgi:hypothetical protein|nr:hypothetical protein [Kofleriaceae bacterium]MBP6841276.1 hypothetical protein [Kofleriaceae bacterium]